MKFYYFFETNMIPDSFTSPTQLLTCLSLFLLSSMLKLNNVVFGLWLNKYKVFGIMYQFKHVVLTLEEDTTLSSSHWELICPLKKNYHRLPVFSVLSQFLLFQNEELLWLTTDKYGEPAAPDVLDCYCIYSLNIETLIFNKHIKIPPYVAKVHEHFSVDLYLMCEGACHLSSEVNASLLYLNLNWRCLFWRTDFVCGPDLMQFKLQEHFFVDDICLVSMRGVDKSNLLADLVKVLIHHEDQLLLYDLKSQECRKIGFLEKDQKLYRHLCISFQQPS